MAAAAETPRKPAVLLLRSSPLVQIDSEGTPQNVPAFCEPDFNHELEAIRAAISAGTRHVHYVIRQATDKMETELADLASKYNIMALHFTGHGGVEQSAAPAAGTAISRASVSRPPPRGYLGFEKSHSPGQTAKLYTEDIAKLMQHEAFSRLQIVTLAACHGSSVVDAFSKVPHVFSTPLAVPDHACSRFSRVLYEQLLKGSSVQAAFDHAVKESQVTWSDSKWLKACNVPDAPDAAGGDVLFAAAFSKASGDSPPRDMPSIAWELGNLPTFTVSNVSNPKAVYQLREHIKNHCLKDQHATHLHVHGDVGVGKSRLAIEACRHLAQHEQHVTLLGVRFPNRDGAAFYSKCGMKPGCTAVWAVISEALKLGARSQEEVIRMLCGPAGNYKVLVLDGVDDWRRDATQDGTAASPTAVGAATAATAVHNHRKQYIVPRQEASIDAMCIEDFIETVTATMSNAAIITTACEIVHVAGAHATRSTAIPVSSLSADAAADMLLRRVQSPQAAVNKVSGSPETWEGLLTAVSGKLQELGVTGNAREIARLADEWQADYAGSAPPGQAALPSESSGGASPYGTVSDAGMPENHAARCSMPLVPKGGCDWTPAELAVCLTGRRQLPVDVDPTAAQHIEAALKAPHRNVHDASQPDIRTVIAVPQVNPDHPATLDEPDGGSAAAVIDLATARREVWPKTFHGMQAYVRGADANKQAVILSPPALQYAMHTFPGDGVAQWVWLKAASDEVSTTQDSIMQALDIAVHTLMPSNSRPLSDAQLRHLSDVLTCKACAGMQDCPARSEHLQAALRAHQHGWAAIPLSLDGNVAAGHGSFRAFWAWMGPTLKVLCNGLLDVWNAREPEVLRGFETLQAVQGMFAEATTSPRHADQGGEYFVLTFSESEGGWLRVMHAMQWALRSSSVQEAQPHSIATMRLALCDKYGYEYSFTDDKQGVHIQGTLATVLKRLRELQGSAVLPSCVPLEDALKQLRHL